MHHRHYLFCRTHELHHDAVGAAEEVAEMGGASAAAQYAAQPYCDMSCDATPPHLISLLLTDLGLLTPSAISDELLERELWSCAGGGPSRPWTSPRISPRGSASAISGLATLTL